MPTRSITRLRSYGTLPYVLTHNIIISHDFSNYQGLHDLLPAGQPVRAPLVRHLESEVVVTRVQLPFVADQLQQILNAHLLINANQDRLQKGTQILNTWLFISTFWKYWKQDLIREITEILNICPSMLNYGIIEQSLAKTIFCQKVKKILQNVRIIRIKIIAKLYYHLPFLLINISCYHHHNRWSYFYQDDNYIYYTFLHYRCCLPDSRWTLTD